MYTNYDPPIYDPKYDWCETESDKTKDEAAHFVVGILDQLYGKKPFNEERLEELIEELCHVLEVRMPKEDLAITQKEDMLKSWINFNNQYLKKLA